MSGSLNKALLIGHLGRDPEIRTTQTGTRVANLSIATSESWRDKNSGDRKEKTEWHRVVVFNDKLVDVIEKYARKGQKVYVEGQIQTRKWTDQSGAEKYSTEIVLQAYGGTFTMLERSGGSEPEEESQDAGHSSGREHGSAKQSNDLDDDIPF